MSITEELDAGVVAAMKSGDTATRDALRIAATRIREAEVAGDQRRTLDAAEAEAVIVRCAKAHDEAAAEYDAAGRTDAAALERAQRAALEPWLPAGLSGTELDELVDRVLDSGGYSAMSDMGPAMRDVMAEVGNRADGKTVSAVVRAKLAG